MSANPEVQWVETPTWQRERRRVLAVATAAGVGVVAAVAWFVASGRSPGLVGALGLGAGLLVFAAALSWSRAPKRIGISAGGVRFVYALNRPYVPWDRLLAPEFYRADQVAFWHKMNARGTRSLPILVSSAQARAILLYPSCPEFDLSLKVRVLLGFPTEGPWRSS